MQFLLSNTFQDSLNELNSEEQKIAKNSAFDLQLNPTNPGLKCHRIDKIRDKNFWSARVNRDIRLIFHKAENSLLLCYVAHHDNAYKWASRRKIETHPITGAAQIVEIRETIQEIKIPIYTQTSKEKSFKKPLSHLTEDELLGYGVPKDWIKDVINANNDDALLLIASHLPSEAAEAVIELATGNKPRKSIPVTKGQGNPYEHPDAQRRFKVLSGSEELAQALDYPWEKWITFLHPDQKEWVVRSFGAATKIQGSAGTGKTVVALHRAVHLVKNNEDSRVLLTTFSEPLAVLLQEKVNRMVSCEPTLTERLDVISIQEIGQRIYQAHIGKPILVKPAKLNSIISHYSPDEINKIYGQMFAIEEFQEIIDTYNLKDWESYRNLRRIGRKSRLNEKRREILWPCFMKVFENLSALGMITENQLFHNAADHLQAKGIYPYQHIVVDECQDISPAQLRLITAMVAKGSDSLFFSGDLGQRIFQKPFSWLQYGVELRGRSKTLKINYRTSHQIRKQSDRLLDKQSIDVDGNIQDRQGAISVFSGPDPDIYISKSKEDEARKISEWIQERKRDGISPREFGVFVRSQEEIERAKSAMDIAGLPYEELKASNPKTISNATLSTMHLAKGLEFKAVIVMACDEDIIPNADRIKSVLDENDLDEIISTERHLLYVAFTRARDYLLITSSGKCSEFIEDIII